jgi:hypothetical protein
MDVQDELKQTKRIIEGKDEVIASAMCKCRAKGGISARQIINATLCLDLSYIQKRTPIEKKPYATHGQVITDSGELISYESNYGNEERYSLEINYNVSQDINYHLVVEVLEVSSNLGKGCFLCFICPVTGRKCRKLYKLPLQDKWASRAAYKGRLYYPLQICSTLQLYLERFNILKAKCKQLENTRATKLYRGRPTKRYDKIQGLLKSKRKAYDDLCLPQATPVALKKLIPPESLKGLNFLVNFD